MRIRFPYGRQTITDDDIAAVTRVLREPMLTQGPQVQAFETALSMLFGGSDVISVGNGTQALHLAYLQCGLGPDRGLVTPPLTFLATANAARMLGAAVHFADVDSDTGLMTPETLRDALETAPFLVGAVAVVHLGGRVADMQGLRAVTEDYGCALVEDACHAPGAAIIDQSGQRQAVGGCAYSDFATFSFHPVKHIAVGEGGAIATRDPDAAIRLRRLRSHSVVREADDWRCAPNESAPWWYEQHELGWNYRLSDIACALGVSQLKRLNVNIQERRRLAARYDAMLDHPALSRPPSAAQNEAHAWHLYAPAIDFQAIGRSRGVVMAELASAGIGSQVHYIPLTLQPYHTAPTPPGVQRYYDRTLSIPLYPGLTDEEQEEIVGVMHRVLMGSS